MLCSLRCCVLHESPAESGKSSRDFTDLLLSWKHLPNITIHDLARGLAPHANLRYPDIIHFSPHEGQYLDPNDANIAAAEEGRLRVSLKGLKEKKITADENGHALTAHLNTMCCTTDFMRITRKILAINFTEYSLCRSWLAELILIVQSSYFHK